MLACPYGCKNTSSLKITVPWSNVFLFVDGNRTCIYCRSGKQKHTEITDPGEKYAWRHKNSLTFTNTLYSFQKCCSAFHGIGIRLAILWRRWRLHFTHSQQGYIKFFVSYGKIWYAIISKTASRIKTSRIWCDIAEWYLIIDKTSVSFSFRKESITIQSKHEKKCVSY